MRLRPHHLLCSQSYSGKGYSDAFVAHMDHLTNKLRNEIKTPVDIVFSTDDLCAHCPHMQDIDLCESNDKVKAYDAKVAKYFHIEEKTYIYQELTAQIRRDMTPDILEDICGDCAWYGISACKRILTENNK